MSRVSVTDLRRMRRKGEPIVMITAYDHPTARLADEAGIPLILVGDSLGMVVLGYDSTLAVGVGDMIHHGAAVVRGSRRAHVVVDMPFGSYQAGWREALRILRAVCERKRVVGFDVVELAPDEGPEACAYAAAKLVYKLFAYATHRPQ